MASRSHLLVDGANVLHAWGARRPAGGAGWEAARSRLVQRVAAIGDAEGARVTIVFDGRGPELVVEEPAGMSGVGVVYAPAGVTADDVIERLVGRAEKAAGCVVATADRGIIETVVAAGGRAMLPADLLAWIERAEAVSTRRAWHHNRTNDARWKRNDL